jgi:hypothetical protein
LIQIQSFANQDEGKQVEWQANVNVTISSIFQTQHLAAVFLPLPFKRENFSSVTRTVQQTQLNCF